MAQIKFQDIKDDLLKAVSDKLVLSPIPNEPKGLTIIEGFINQPVQPELGNIVLGGPAIPTIALIGNFSGRIYIFALKALLPNLEI